MYLYIYDEFIQDKRYEKDVLQIENRLTDLGIAGKIARLALFRDPVEMIRDEIRRGVTNVIVVGNDQTVRKILDVAAEGKVTLGLIPLGTPDALAHVLGVPPGLAACDVLSTRIVETIDLGVVNNRRFLNALVFPNFKAELVCENAYRITPRAPATLEILNLGAGSEPPPGGHTVNPSDGRLEAVLRVKLPKGWNPFSRAKTGESLIPGPAFSIRSDDPIKAFIDGEEIQATRFDVGVETNALRVITGRNRLF